MATSLLQLPPELRLIIYEKVFEDVLVKDGKLDRKASGLEVLHVCRQLRQEAETLLDQRFHTEAHSLLDQAFETEKMGRGLISEIGDALDEEAAGLYTLANALFEFLSVLVQAYLT